jgi:hypothetical protein
VHAERERLARQLERIERRLAAVLEERDRLIRGAEELRERLTVLAQLGSEPEEPEGEAAPPAVRALQNPDRQPPLGLLRGGAIREVAVRLLAASKGPDRPIHYTSWYELLRDAGYGVAGRDPLATFLTQINRSPVVRRAGDPGLYRLDLDAVPRLRGRLRLLHDELIALHRGQQTIEEIASVRERRAELAAECGRVERALEEALEALGVDGNDADEPEAE